MKDSCSVISVMMAFSNFKIFTTFVLMILNMCDHVDMVMGQSTSSQAPPGGNQITPPPPTLPRSIRIAVPVKSGFREFVSIDHDNITGEQTFNGFSIDVFNAVNSALSSPLSFNFVPFAKPDGTMNGTYDDMLQAVFSQEYDAAVGDITMRYYRTEWVDFTLPYSETGVSMLVPRTPQSTKSTKISLMPLLKGLVSATLVFCFISALVSWFVEFQNDKRGKVLPQSLGANAQGHHANSDDKWRREILRAIIHTRLVMVLCFLVLLFLASYYTASLTSLLTVQRQRVPIKNLNQLIRNRENVGFQRASFVKNLLTQTGFSETQLLGYSSEKEMLDLLSKGTAQGGVAAVIDEILYLKLFLAKHCNAYTLVPSVNFHADGFGFAFQRGSSLVRDISDGILKVMDDEQLAKIQDRTIGNSETCEDDTSIGADFNFLDFDTLWILLAGAIGITLLVILLYVVYFGTVCGIRRRSVAYPCYLLRN